MSIKPKLLKRKHSVSKGASTYGYGIVTLTDTETGKRYQTNGGGYDMWGTVLGSWVNDNLQDELLAYLQSKGMKGGDGAHSGMTADEKGWPYGCDIDKKGKASINGMIGACSVANMIRALGYELRGVSYKDHRGEWQDDGVIVWKVADAS